MSFYTVIPIIKKWSPLLLISSLSLFLELAVIRWLSGEIRLLAYFKNLTLLAVFLGLAIGFALVGKGRDHRFTFPVLWGLFVILVVAVGTATAEKSIPLPSASEEHIWFTASISFITTLLLFLGIVLIFFLISMFLFIPLGQATGEEMAKHPPVKAYVVNILASLLGVWIFSLLSFLETPPLVWFFLALAGISLYYAYLKKLKISWMVIFGATLVIVAVFNQGHFWSPYNRLSLEPLTYNRETDGETVSAGYILNVQQIFYQVAVNLSDDFIKTMNEEYKDDVVQVFTETAFGYNLPYRLAPPGSRVLIVGSGMGNDVAAALRNGMGSIDAVEIDPTIYRLGLRLHPEHPYQDPKVQVFIDDARSFFNKHSPPYDLIAFGLLDSHTLLSSFSSVRLDSFVYTLNSFQQVKKLVREGGWVVLIFAVNEWIEERLGLMMSEVFGRDNLWVYSSGEDYAIFIAGPVSPEQAAAFHLQPWKSNPAVGEIPLPTDDWPYLYLRGKIIPSGTWQGILLIIVLCLLIIRRSFPEALKPDWHFWLLGAAFLLIEFKSITELALLFGTTWFVNSLAISGVLLMALCANLIVLNTKRIPINLVYILLFSSLLISYFFPLEWLANFPGILKALVSMVFLSLPLFFSGMIFSESLRRAGETSRPLASNFSGSAVGGLLEYSSLFWGIKSLYLTAALLYLGSLLAVLRGSRQLKM